MSNDRTISENIKKIDTDKNPVIMIQGTGSSVGKSVVVAGLCRVMYQDGLRPAPFKSQNMALNSFITKEGGEMGRAQVVQAEAAGLDPHIDMNPVLLKPSTDRKAQVILEGEVFKNLSAVEYHEFKGELKTRVKNAYDRLQDKHGVVVIEGAGSPAEINLKENDIVNMGMAELADAPVLIVGDIDRGGVFASLYGTVMLLDEDERKRVKGLIINKFRGDLSILQSGLDMMEELTGLPILGVIPYSDIRVEDEDSLSERFSKVQDKSKQIQIEILYLPHVSNFTDFQVFETQPDVNVRYVMRGESISEPDVLIIPGSKNSIEDMVYLRQFGLEEQIIRLARKGKYIVGICGGYQMLGRTLQDPYHTESNIEKTNGLALLDVDTVFEKEKTTTQITGKLASLDGDLKNLSGSSIKGYEIHMGQTTRNAGVKPFVNILSRLDTPIDVLDGAINETGKVFGTYVHGIFDDIDFCRGFLNVIREQKGLEHLQSEVESFEAYKEKAYDDLADMIRENLDMDKIYQIMADGV